jgi:hypothetical protein
MTEYDLFVPLCLPNGRKVGRQKIKRLKQRLVKEFGGLTWFPQKNEGIWKMGGTTFRDAMAIMRVLGPSPRQTKAFWREIKAALKADFGQHTVLIISRRVALV